MSRLGGAAAVAPLVADMSPEVFQKPPLFSFFLIIIESINNAQKFSLSALKLTFESSKYVKKKMLFLTLIYHTYFTLVDLEMRNGCLLNQSM
jgi:hypothetical protein